MTAGKIIGYLAAAIVIFFGILFIWGAFGDNGQTVWIPIGLVSVLIGFGLIWLVGRSKPAMSSFDGEIQVKLELPGDVNLEPLQCQSCGGDLTGEHVHMISGSPVIICPYCQSTYQLTEEPKW